MPRFETIRSVRHSAEQMFSLVADVERYPEFVPLCERLLVRRRHTQEDGKEVLVAEMTVAYKVVRETFTTKVTLDREKLHIDVRYLDGPFKSLENIWAFRPKGENACEIRFYLAYEFRSRTLAMLMNAVFDRFFRMFAHAFETRADTLYGVI
jgi:coenzyme Q-binding protein COQ10